MKGYDGAGAPADGQGLVPRPVDAGPDLDSVAAAARACRICAQAPAGRTLPHEPNPIFQVSRTARLLIASQAAGTRAHAAGRPFDDRSGERLREWLGIGRDTFYDRARVAILPMGFCFPGLDANGSDLPPRRECAPAWRARMLAAMPQIELVLAVGLYAQAWHLGSARGRTLAATVATWRELIAVRRAGPTVLPLPHPSWRNNAWLQRNPWFERELVPSLRAEVRRLTSTGCGTRI